MEKKNWIFERLAFFLPLSRSLLASICRRLVFSARDAVFRHERLVLRFFPRAERYIYTCTLSILLLRRALYFSSSCYITSIVVVVVNSLYWPSFMGLEITNFDN